MSIIYGVDTTKEVTPEMVREAMVECFYSAHCYQSGVDSGNNDLTRDYCKQIVFKAFVETKGDFEHPTKASLAAAISWLADFSKMFRNQSVIQKHISEIQELISCLKD